MSTESLGSPLRAIGRIVVYVTFTLAMIPVQAALVLVGARAQTYFPVWYHRRCCRLLGFRVARRGKPVLEGPVLFVSNHCSYLDIMVLGSQIPASFVAKAEVARWPLFGTLAKLQRSVFVDRQSFRAAAQREEMLARLEAGDSLILFPEGTSSDGNRVLPFKSSLLSVAELHPGDRPLTVQPISIAYTMLDGLPLGRYLRPFFAWYGEMDMVSHLWQWAGLGRLTVVVRFHDPVTIDQFGSRKALSEYCYDVVSRGLAEALAGRRQVIRRQPDAAAGPKVEPLVPAALSDGPSRLEAVQGAEKGPLG
jgi:1-acyl-sn-glycerol-3-phosphate acyltransferase